MDAQNEWGIKFGGGFELLKSEIPREPPACFSETEWRVCVGSGDESRSSSCDKGMNAGRTPSHLRRGLKLGRISEVKEIPHSPTDNTGVGVSAVGAAAL